MTIVDLATERSKESGCIEMLRTLTAKAEQGDVVSFAGVFERADGEMDFEMSATRNKHTMAGRLLDLAVQRLNYTPDGK